MKSLCSIERIAIIRWVTIAYLGALVLPLLFLRYGNTIAVAQSALLIALPIATAGLALSHAKVPASYVSFSIHDKVLLRFIAKSLLLAQVVNLCLSLLYVSIIGELVNERLSSHTALVLVFSSVVLTLACFALRLWTTSLVSWIVIIFFVVAGLPISTGDFANSPVLFAVVPTTWVSKGATFGYIFSTGILLAAISSGFLLRSVKRA
ncbi:cytochrome C oxidase subunit IV [Rothia mucilaginosa]|uniref:cytochrome C oxidase subunit IV n=1 Tax=Rothia mucilaginosa TaxID=43675 RepID=UPI0026F36D02|nr:cytochrome C oxidase subunit IV [Rothia mucilaginosa]